MIPFLGTIIVALLGLCVGSFLNSVLFRMQEGKRALSGRSSCPSCGHTLAWHDLIPVVSFLLLRGKCRYCKKLISPQYPLVELATATLFVLMFYYLNLGIIQLLYLWVISSLLVVIFIYDLKHFIIPDRFIYPAILVSGIWYFVFSELPKYQILNTVYSAIGAASFFFLIHTLSKGRAMGFGDVKLALFMGLFLGWPNILVALFCAFFLGAAVGIFLVLSSKKEWKSQVPFGPFLITGTFIALFWGENLIRWYLNLILI